MATPVMWRLASNSDIQQVVAGATPVELMNPLLQYHLGIRLLSERNYRPAAAEAFDHATGAPEVRDNAFVLYVYALCMSGQRAKAAGYQQRGVCCVRRNVAAAAAVDLDEGDVRDRT